MVSVMKLQAVLLEGRDGNLTFAQRICEDDEDLRGFWGGDKKILKRQDFPISPGMLRFLPMIQLILAEETFPI